MPIKSFPSGPLQTNAYVVFCETTSRALIIDPAPGCFGVITTFIASRLLFPEKILITHSHWDHIADAAALSAHYNIPIYIHELDAKNLEEPGSDLIPCRIKIPAAKPSAFLNEGDMITVGHLSFTVIHTPGHSPGGVCFYCQKERLLLTGDTFFRGCIGTLSLPTANPELMWESLKKIEKLPFDTKVFPGHGLSTTIGAETWLPNAKNIFS